MIEGEVLTKAELKALQDLAPHEVAWAIESRQRAGELRVVVEHLPDGVIVGLTGELAREGMKRALRKEGSDV